MTQTAEPIVSIKSLGKSFGAHRVLKDISVAFSRCLGMWRHHGANAPQRRVLIINCDAQFDLRKAARPNSGIKHLPRVSSF